MSAGKADVLALTAEQERQLRDAPEVPDLEDCPEAPAQNWLFAQTGPFQPWMRKITRIRFDDDIVAWLARRDGDLSQYVNSIIRDRMKTETGRE